MIAVSPSLEELRALLADHDVVPLWAAMPMGGLTPADVLEALGGAGTGFILESAGGQGQRAGWSFVGLAPVASLLAAAEDPLRELELHVASRRVAPVAGLDAPFIGGAVGMLAYEAARRYEELPVAAADPLRMPDAWFGLHDTVIAFDHQRDRIVLIETVHSAGEVDAVHARARERLQGLHQRISEMVGAPDLRSPGDRTVHAAAYESSTNMSRDRFHRAVERGLEYIVAGDIFQVQISRRFGVALQAHPLALYRALRAINPSPYMVYMAMPHATLVGASPEMLLRVTGRHLDYHPIAGTRGRGRTPDDDARMEQELRGSEKEAAEHMMLVDLGRNDVGRVAATGSVQVTQLMDVERYSHVMHLVSHIEASLADGCSSLDALRACFPAGTVTGAPKLRAMEIIAELEPEARGAYAGAMGYVRYGGDLDAAIALRTIVVKEGMAYAQAAGGIVADSTPHEEALEIDNKVAAQLLAIEVANAT